ncbi:hypothetical protein BC826DRAFT_1105825 [Russula brevipes]|nr:hypothetical protein BC826DRAFT_1105825 [Russula brevipes]
MSRFNNTKVNCADGTVEIGAGLTWDQVYVALNSTGVNVVGGHVSGVGVAGSTLGGGYSFQINQYGLTIDNIVGYELVLPNGTVMNLTPENHDLWFGLRGGMNNFGIVTKFILTSRPQGEIWGGLLVYAENQLDAIKEALIKFQQKKDTKADLIVTFFYSSGQLSILVFYFYDAPSPGKIFEDFLAIPSTQGSVSTQSFSDLILSLKFQPSRTYFNSVPVTQYLPTLFDVFLNQTKFWGARLSALDPNMTLACDLNPFDSGIFSHGSPSAYPPERSLVTFPSLFAYGWTNASLDQTMALALRESSDTVHAAALAEGQDVSHAAVYVNYALFDTPLEDIYGRNNLERLRKIKAEIDPEDVMGLAGGFKF